MGKRGTVIRGGESPRRDRPHSSTVDKHTEHKSKTHSRTISSKISHEGAAWLSRMPGTLKRGLFHIFAGLSVAVVALFIPRMVLLTSIGVVTFVFLAFDILRLRSPGINRWFFSHFKWLLREEEASHLTGASYMLVGSLIAFLVFQRDIAVLAICFLAIGDAVATITGKYLGRMSIFGKTVEGDLACFISCVVTGFVFYYAGFNIGLLAILVGSLGATIAEVIPLPINDNLTMPLLAGLAMTMTQL